MVRVGINGFGRIGRMVLRAIWESQRQGIQVVAINDLGSLESNAHLFKYDSIHGRFPGTVHTTDQTLDVGMGPIRVVSEPDPAKLGWGEWDVDVVMECSGRFTSRESAGRHLAAGAKRVLISAPADKVDFTAVYGVNHQQLSAAHHVVSNGSCTTNCLAPVVSVLQGAIGIEQGYMTTIHAYTGDQRIVDTLHPDLRRARAAGSSMIPTSTGAAKALGLVFPELEGKLDGTAIRVPVANVSLIDFCFTTKRSTSREEINRLMREAANGSLKGVLGVVEEPLVSVDFNHVPLSATFDLTQTQIMGDRFCRVLAWYDNEWGFANRMNDVALVIGSLLT